MKLTCLTATYNAIDAGNRENLIRCINSVAALDVPHEHIIIDGASTDGTEKLVRTLQRKIDSLVLISERDSGIYNALNKGVRAAKGEWLYVLGCDDYICNPRILDDIVLDDCANRGMKMIVSPVMYDGGGNYSFQRKRDLRAMLCWLYGYCHQGVLIRTETAKSLGGFDERYRLCADGDMCIKVHLRHYPIRYAFKAFANFSSGGANERLRSKVEDEQSLVLKRHLRLSDSEHQFLRKAWLPPLRIALRYVFGRDEALRISARYAAKWWMGYGLRIAICFWRRLREGWTVCYLPEEMSRWGGTVGFAGSAECDGVRKSLLWMVCNRARLRIPIPRDLIGREIRLSFGCSAVISEKQPRQDAVFSVGGYELKTETFGLNTCMEKEVSFRVPAVLNESDSLDVSISFSEPFVPISSLFPGTSDNRTLGARFFGIAISDACRIKSVCKPEEKDAETFLKTLREKPVVGTDGSPASAPVVSVVTVVFNAVKGRRAEPFRRCLDSVQSQTGVLLEHLIIDGGSEDGTVGIIRNYANANVPIRYVSCRDRGIYDAMNRGLKLASGKYVIFLNSDDYYHDAHGMQESAAALERSGADFAYGPARVVDEKGDEIVHAFTTAIPYLIYGGMTICHQTVMTRREVMERLGGFDLRYRSASDYDFLLRMIFTGCKAVRVKTPFVTFQAGGFSYANAGLADREVASIYKELYNRYADGGLSDEESMTIRKTGSLPDRISRRLERYGEHTFLSDFTPDETIVKQLRDRAVYVVEVSEGDAYWARSTPGPLWRGPLKKALHLIRFMWAHRDSIKEMFREYRVSGQSLREYIICRCRLQARRQNFYVFAFDRERVLGDWRPVYSGMDFTQKLSIIPELPESWRNVRLLLGLYLIPDSDDPVTVSVRANGVEIDRIDTARFAADGPRHEVVVPSGLTSQSLRLELPIERVPGLTGGVIFGGLSYHPAV